MAMLRNSTTVLASCCCKAMRPRLKRVFRRWQEASQLNKLMLGPGLIQLGQQAFELFMPGVVENLHQQQPQHPEGKDCPSLFSASDARICHDLSRRAAGWPITIF